MASPYSDAWQRRLKTPMARIASLVGSPKLSDIELTFPGRTDTIKAHRLVLAMSSPVFEEQLYGPEACGRQLHIPEEDPEAFAWTLGYMYCNRKTLPSPLLAIAVYRLAQKYKMDALLEIAEEYLSEHLTEPYFAEIYNAAVACNNAPLLQRCAKIARERSGHVLAPPVLLKFNRETVAHLLQQILSVGSETKIFRAVLCWGKCQLEKQRVEQTRGNLRREIEPLLPYVRVLTMSADEFSSKVLPTGVFTVDEGMHILMAIANERVYELPSICCKIRDKRQIFDKSLLRHANLCVHSPLTNVQCQSGESTLILYLKADKTVCLYGIHFQGLEVTAFTVTTRDPAEQMVKVVHCPGTSGVLTDVITLHPGMSASFVASHIGLFHSCVGDFTCVHEGVTFSGRILSKNLVTLYYWNFDE